jgi:hypothetical protein
LILPLLQKYPEAALLDISIYTGRTIIKVDMEADASGYHLEDDGELRQR